MPARSELPFRLILLSILIVAVSTQPVFLLGAAFLQMGPEFGYGPTGLGLLTAAFFLTASISSAPLGRLVERLGWPQAMRINAAAAVVLPLAIALLAHVTAVLAALLIAAGLFYGFANPAANQALAEKVPPRRLALVFGLKHGGIPSSTLLAGLAVPLIIVTVGWRAAYGAAALLGVLVYLAVPRSPAAVSRPPRQADPRRAIRPLPPGLLVWLAAGSAFASWVAIALGTYLVAAAVDVGFSDAVAGLLLFAGSAVSIAARVTFGALSDRMGATGFGAMAVLMGVGSGVFLLLTTATGAGFALLVLAAFATGWGWPGLMTYTVVNANAARAASSSAITQAGVFVGAGSGPVVIGWVVDRFGFDAAWFTVAAALVIAGSLMAFVGKLSVRR